MSSEMPSFAKEINKLDEIDELKRREAELTKQHDSLSPRVNHMHTGEPMTESQLEQESREARELEAVKKELGQIYHRLSELKVPIE